jgi:hypothetical protein
VAATVQRGSRHRRTKSRRFRKFLRHRSSVFWFILSLAWFFAVNLIYQVYRKPGELFAPVSGSLAKAPAETWESYGALFDKYSTSVISAPLLAALAQVESDGNPVARTYWRWRWSWNPLEIYRPASSAVGMFQLTDGTFAEARKYCIRDHQVVGADDAISCRFTDLYTRTLPSHAVELTAAYLHRNVVSILASRRIKSASTEQKQQLAAVIHLCGVKNGASFAGRGFHPAPGERCGSHSLQRYLNQVDQMKKRFAQLAAS